MALYPLAANASATVKCVDLFSPKLVKKFCYFDNNATTRIAPEVVEAMLPFLSEMWGNPSSAYGFGSQVGKHIDQARERVAALIHADPKEVVFTSCGTESNNAAIHSALTTHPEKRHVVTTAVEHSANIKYANTSEGAVAKLRSCRSNPTDHWTCTSSITPFARTRRSSR
jgi:cysteine sulfinate desulfinase/cysteine desulfurase-like protein